MRERVLEYLNKCILNAVVSNKGLIYDKIGQVIPFADLSVTDGASHSSVRLDFGSNVLLEYNLNWIEKEGGLFKLGSIS